MKKETVSLYIQVLLTPVLLVLLGIILVLHPDFASSVIAAVLRWALLILGIGCALSGLIDRSQVVRRMLFALVCFGISGWLLANPLNLAAAIGRIVGIFVALRGIQDTVNAMQWKSGMALSLITTAVGILLIVLPMTASRLVFTVCGIVVLVIAVPMLLERLRLLRRLLPPDEGNIVDAR